MSDETFESVVYRWHELMFRLDEMDEAAATGMAEDEVPAFDKERAAIAAELLALEARLGTARVSGLQAGHERDRAYARQLRQIEEEDAG